MRAKRHKAEQLRSTTKTKTKCSKLKLNFADVVQIQSQNNSPGKERCASAPIPIRSNKETTKKLKVGYHCQVEATVLLPQAPIAPQDSDSMHSAFSLSPLPYREKRSAGSATNERKKGENPVSSFIVRPSAGSISPLTLPPSLHEPCAYIDYSDYNQEKPTYKAQHPSPTSVALPYSSSLKNNHIYHDSHDRRSCGASYFILDECVPRSNLYYALEQYDASKKLWSSFDTLTDHEDGNSLSERKAFQFSSPKCIPHIQSWTPSPDF